MRIYKRKQEKKNSTKKATKKKITRPRKRPSKKNSTKKAIPIILSCFLFSFLLGRVLFFLLSCFLTFLYRFPPQDMIITNGFINIFILLPIKNKRCNKIPASSAKTLGRKHSKIIKNSKNNLYENIKY